MLDVAVIGAGPYGLSAAAHLKQRGIEFRLFGRPMDTWLTSMPKGMLLKSDGFASNIYDPEGRFPLSEFCADRGIEYADTGTPVRLETFTDYGLAFMDQFALSAEDKMVTLMELVKDGFLLQLDNGERVKAHRVVLAVGITHFAHVPDILAHLPPELLSHSRSHRDLEPFRGRDVVVIGAGASALDLAGLLYASGASVKLVTRSTKLKFHTKPTGKPRSWWRRMRHPQSGLGPGLRSRFFADAPFAFHYLPEQVRLLAVRKALGPSGGWFSKDLVVGKVPLYLGHRVHDADVRHGRLQLHLRTDDGAERKLEAQHVIAATGYRVDLERLTFLSEKIRSNIKAVNGTPVLSSDFEASVRGLYFLGVAAANSFGPVMRFAFGAGFAAKRLTEAMAKSPSHTDAVASPANLLADPE